MFSTIESLLRDVFIPHFGILADVIRQQTYALRRPQVDHFNPTLAQPVDASGEVFRLTDDDRADLELHDQSAAIPTRRERGHHDFVAIIPLSAGFTESIGLGMYGRIVFLHPPIVPGAEEFAGSGEQRGANGDAAFGPTLTCFI